MNFEAPNFNSYEDPENNLENSLNKESEPTELELTAEDLRKLVRLQDKIQQIETSSFQKQQKFVEATEDFLNKLDEIYEEGELNEFAAVSFLKGEGISPEAKNFDLDGEYSVMAFVESFDK